MSYWIKNTKGKPDSMLTFSTIAFAIVSFCILLSCFKSVAFKTFSLELSVPDTSLLLGFLASTLGSYVMRRNKDQVKEQEKKE